MAQGKRKEASKGFLKALNKGSKRTCASCPVCHKKITVSTKNTVSTGDGIYHTKCYKNR